MTQELLGRVHRELIDVLNSINQDEIHHDGDDFHELLNDVEKALAQPEQEPVACERCKQLEEHAYDLVGELRVANMKLSMRPQRTWVRLTDEEIKALASWWPSYDQMPALMALAKDIQNSLKEKNT